MVKKQLDSEQLISEAYSHAKHQAMPCDSANNIAFTLLLEVNSEQQSLPAHLPCQCLVQLSPDNTHSPVEAPRQLLDMDTTVADWSGIYLLLTIEPALINSLVTIADQKQSCTLRLCHQETEIEVLGSCHSFEAAESKVQFIFAEPSSMQAKMILQLVKICQMKAELTNELSNDVAGELDTKSNNEASINDPEQCIAYVAKCWSEEFAADFAEKFDKNK